jgi:hypothetical protein
MEDHPQGLASFSFSMEQTTLAVQLGRLVALAES